MKVLRRLVEDAEDRLFHAFIVNLPMTVDAARKQRRGSAFFE
jgi:hypothetical protein